MKIKVFGTILMGIILIMIINSAARAFEDMLKKQVSASLYEQVIGSDVIKFKSYEDIKKLTSSPEYFEKMKKVSLKLEQEYYWHFVIIIVVQILLIIVIALVTSWVTIRTVTQSIKP